jgi:hypothetical protein
LAPWNAGEELSGHALRARLAAETQLRLDLQALGLKRREPRAQSLAGILEQQAEKPRPPRQWRQAARAPSPPPTTTSRPRWNPIAAS